MEINIFFSILYGEVLEQVLWEIVALLFLEIYRSQGVKHGATWSDLQAEAA